jgi:hypothetical protein
MVNVISRQKRISLGYANHVALFPELNWWPDETQVEVEQTVEEIHAAKLKAEEKRKRIRTRNLILVTKGGIKK